MRLHVFKCFKCGVLLEHTYSLPIRIARMGSLLLLILYQFVLLKCLMESTDYNSKRNIQNVKLMTMQVNLYFSPTPILVFIKVNATSPLSPSRSKLNKRSNIIKSFRREGGKAFAGGITAKHRSSQKIEVVTHFSSLGSQKGSQCRGNHSSSPFQIPIKPQDKA